MQNKANLGWSQIGISSFMTSKYVEFCCFVGLKNKANSKPIKKEWVCKPSSVYPAVLLRKSEAAGTTAIYLDRPLPTGSPPPFCFAKTKQRGKRPTRRMNGQNRSRPGRAIQLTWSCRRWGLPCRRRYRRRGALLPHHFTFACFHKGISAVYFLWHFPAACPGWSLATTVALSCSDFPPPFLSSTEDTGATVRPTLLNFQIIKPVNSIMNDYNTCSHLFPLKEKTR